MRLAKVILDIPTTSLDRAYTYAVPDTDEAGDFPIRVGCAVLVPFGNRREIGFVVEMEEVPDEFAGAETLFVDDTKVAGLKTIVRALSTPYFDEVGARCAEFMAHRYVAPLSTCVKLFTPHGGVPTMGLVNGHRQVKDPVVGEVDDRWVVPGPAFGAFEPRGTAVKQKAVLEVLASGEVRVAELAREYGSVSEALRALEKHGAVVVEHRRRIRGVGEARPDAAFVPAKRPQLTAAQEAALAAIRETQARGGGTVLVDGITGSGKTEVYLRAIEDALEAGKTALVLVPEISLTPQTVARFCGRFGDVVAVLHSEMGAGERYDQWDFIRSGRARVVVGARSALFAPLRRVGIIVIDEEHESTYKQENAPRYVTRDVAEWLTRQYGCALVLGSATPSLESLYRVESDSSWVRVELAERANGKPLPPITVVDRAAEFRSGTRSRMFSAPLAMALQEELCKGHKCILFLNQRGFARFLLCRDCGFVPECEDCATSLTLHERGRQGPHLKCHHCGHTEQVPARCPVCGSPYLRAFGTGTQQVEDELHRVLESFPTPANTAKVVRMDRDTTAGKGAHRKLLDDFAAPGPAVLLGTQMIAKGLDFENVTLVGVISADTMLSVPDFRSAERTFALIEQVAGRAGRADLPGRVIVQTYRPDEAAIRAAATYDRRLFLDDELPKRRLLGYPRYVRLVNIIVAGEDDDAAFRVAADLEARLRTAFAELGPEGPSDLSTGTWFMAPATPCALSKFQGKFRHHIMAKVALGADPTPALEAAIRHRKASPGVSVSVDVDAFNLL